MTTLCRLRRCAGLGLLIALPLVLAVALGSRAKAEPSPTVNTEVTIPPELRLGNAAIEMGDTPCITDCKCVQKNCAAGQRSCTACWMTKGTNRACAPSDAEKPYYGLKCPQSTRPNCVTDCRCVQQKCPPGTRSCTACWWWEKTQQACTPLEEEKSKYGLSCDRSGM